MVSDYSESVQVPASDLGADITVTVDITITTEGDSHFLIYMQSVACNSATFTCLAPQVIFQQITFGVADNCPTGNMKPSTKS